MMIGLVSTPWLPVPPQAYGGTETLVDALARGLAAAGHDVLLAAPSGSTCPVPHLPGLPAAVPEHLGETVPELAHVVAAYQGLVAAGVDVIHDHTTIGPLYAGRPRDVVPVATMHGAVVGQMHEIYRAMGRTVALVAISADQAATAPDVQIAAVIHHGLDVARIPVGRGDGGYVCFLGRMDPCKGVHEAVLVARRAGLPLRIAGKMAERTEKEYFAQVISPLLGRDAEYVGELRTAEKYALVGGAVALLNPIEWSEPFGLVMIEALATGTPVVATPRGSAPEIVDDGVTGFLRDDRDSLAQALHRAGELDRRRCREVATTRFSAARMAADHVRLYTRLLEGRHLTSPEGPRAA